MGAHAKNEHTSPRNESPEKIKIAVGAQSSSTSRAVPTMMDEASQPATSAAVIPVDERVKSEMRDAPCVEIAMVQECFHGSAGWQH